MFGMKFIKKMHSKSREVLESLQQQGVNFKDYNFPFTADDNASYALLVTLKN